MEQVNQQTGEVTQTAVSETPAPKRSPEFQALLDKPLGDAFQSLGEFEKYTRMATQLASGSMIPDRFKGNVGDCVIALNLANRMQVDLLEVLQSLYVVNGQPAWSATFIISRINSSGRYKSELDFEYSQDKNACKAVAVKKDGTKIEGTTITIKMAKDEGWYGKKGSKWPNMPEQMLLYRAATFFARKYCPDLIFGLPSVDEAEDIITETTPEITEPSKSDLNEILTSADSAKAKEVVGPTYAQIADKIKKSKTPEDLDRLRDAISSIKNPQHRLELIQLSEQRAALIM